MKAREIRQLNGDQLGDTLADTCKRLFKLRFTAATEKLDAPSELKKLRKDIARLKTIQRERELAADKKK